MHTSDIGAVFLRSTVFVNLFTFALLMEFSICVENVSEAVVYLTLSVLRFPIDAILRLQTNARCTLCNPNVVFAYSPLFCSIIELAWVLLSFSIRSLWIDTGINYADPWIVCMCATNANRLRCANLRTSHNSPSQHQWRYVTWCSLRCCHLLCLHARALNYVASIVINW